jgi:streptogramin lyase
VSNIHRNVRRAFAAGLFASGCAAALAAATALGAPRPPGPRVVGPRETAPGQATYTFRARGLKKARFRCSFDSPDLHACPATYTVELREGAHFLRVQAIAKRRRPSAVTRVRIDAKAALQPAGSVVARISVASANGVVFAAGAAWVPLHHSGAVARIDPATNAVTNFPVTSDPGQKPGSLTYGDGALWLVNYTSPGVAGSVVRIDPATGQVIASVPLPAELCCDPIVGGGSLWAIAPELSGGSVLKVSEGSNTLVATIPIEHAFSGAYGAGSVWIGSSGEVLRLDPATNAATARIAVSGLVVGFGAGTLWIDATTEVVRVDPSTNAVVGRVVLPDLRTDEELHFVALDGDRAWIAGTSANRPVLWRVDLATNAVTGVVHLDDGVGGRVGRVAVGAGAVWAAVGDAVVRVAPG